MYSPNKYAMNSSQTLTAPARDIHPNRRRQDQLFFAAFTVAAIATVLAGFGPTYYLKASGGPPLAPLVRLHAALFTSWMVLFAVQVFLVAGRRTDLHRRLGVLGIIVAMAILVAGYITAIAGARTGWTGPRNPRDTVEALNFLVVPLGDLALFLGFVAPALYYRRQPQTHKRLMILAMIGGIMPAAFGRLPGPAAIPVVLTLLLAGPVYDRICHKRIHPAYLWGTAVILLSIPFRLLLSRTEAWHQFATWLVH